MHDKMNETFSQNIGVKNIEDRLDTVNEYPNEESKKKEENLCR